MSSYSPINELYLKDKDASAPFDSPIIDMAKPTLAINYQFVWDEAVQGELVWEASLFKDPYHWETMVSCGEVRFKTNEEDLIGGSNIIALPQSWLTVGYIRFTFTPIGVSSGLINAAIRVVPI